MIRQLDSHEMKQARGGADATVNLGALGSITVDAAMPALAAIAAGVNGLLIGVVNALGGLLGPLLA
ncbi:hypothetical protein TVNIR_2513 [Thioalkalivibrio nitratireducens DSM 14787]|uniref:Uncharacterized protein n=1 Tax=Thioalkalivibrio nitratireducens (strain DSM 14787 / UNIQEM 213 / ALEN2) TaxID=1255043 RepID=L0E0J0_THIND|nr:hypothetical protein [Thioalkalivibrio nitratireducens]AGA34156.1 hypothetical protein TVNIR_2513 [Thioalkalivibrio nitratireducens DSM 14787]